MQLSLTYKWLYISGMKMTSLSVHDASYCHILWMDHWWTPYSMNPIAYVYWHIWSWRPCQHSRIYNPTYHHKLQWYKNTMHLLWMTTLFSHSVSFVGCLEGKLFTRSRRRRNQCLLWKFPTSAGHSLLPSSLWWKNFLLKHTHTWHDIKALL